MKKKLLLLVNVFFFFKINADTNCNIEGQLFEKNTTESIPFASINIKNSNIFVSSDSDGTFSIDNICKDTVLIINATGYQSLNFDYKPTDDSNKIELYLTPTKALQLDAITVENDYEEIKSVISVAKSTIKSEKIVHNPTQSLANVLADEEGVTIASHGTNVQVPVIHGLYGNRVLILNEGIKHGFQNWGTDHAPEINMNSASKITVHKGASGVKYGPEALAGAIVIEQNSLELNKPFSSQVGTGYQSNGRGYFTDIKLSKGLEKTSYYLDANYTKIGDRHAPDYSLTNTGKEETSINTGFRYNKEKWDFNFKYNFVDQNIGILRASIADDGESLALAINSDEPLYIKDFSYDINEPNQLTTHHFGKIEINWEPYYNSKYTLRIGGQLNKRQEFDVRRNSNLPIIDLDLITNDYQLEWTHPEFKDLKGYMGLQAFYQDNNNNPGTQTTPFIPNYNIYRYSTFIFEKKEYNNNIFEVGIRIDYEINDVRGRETNQDLFEDHYSFSNLTASTGWVKTISDNKTLRSNIGTAWRMPNMAELYSFGQHGFKNTYGLLRYIIEDGGSLNTNSVTLMDESSVTPETGFKWITEYETNANKNSYKLTAYSHLIKNYIFERPVDILGTVRGPMPAYIVTQSDALFIGADFSWNKQHNDNLSSKYYLSALWSRNIEDDEVLINQPPITTEYKINWKTPKFWNLSESQISLNTSYTFEQFQAPRVINPQSIIDQEVTLTADSEIFDFKEAPKGYFLVNIDWNFKFKNISGNILVENLLNTRYRNYLNDMRYFADEPGINIIFNLNYLF